MKLFGDILKWTGVALLSSLFIALVLVIAEISAQIEEALVMGSAKLATEGINEATEPVAVARRLTISSAVQEEDGLRICGRMEQGCVFLKEAKVDNPISLIGITVDVTGTAIKFSSGRQNVTLSDVTLVSQGQTLLTTAQ